MIRVGRREQEAGRSLDLLLQAQESSGNFSDSKLYVTLVTRPDELLS